ncbi:cytochrome P450 [Rugosimonospora acidiphila]|uniref:Cytochrome P450 n=2 Tax=Rugosimonospora acidiphila TaxID=556531 RepID=A0ABP9RXA8_9ACTN
MEIATKPLTAPGALPVFGHVLPLLRDPLAFLASLPASGDLARIRIGPFSAVVVCDPELTRQVLRDDASFDKGGPLFDRAREIAGGGVATCPHGQHRRQRSLVQPAFHHDRIPGYAQTMTAQIAAVAGSWRDGQVLDIPAETLKITMGAGVETMFSGELPPTALRETLDDLATVFAGMYRRAIMPPAFNRLPTPANRRYHQARTRLRHTIDALIAERRAHPADRGDLLSALLTARDVDGDGGGLAEAEISDQVITFFLGGPESTANALAWALHLVAQHPHVEERLYAELDSVLAGALPTLDHLPRLALTGRIITETLRLYPPLWMLTRVTTAPVQLGDHRLPANTTLVYSPYLLHHRGDLFEDPERFDPERWDGDHRPSRRGAFIPFGSGPRRCVGDQFGITMATLSLAAITARWRLQSLPSHPPRPTAALTLRPRGLQMRATVRATHT